MVVRFVSLWCLGDFWLTLVSVCGCSPLGFAYAWCFLYCLCLGFLLGFTIVGFGFIVAWLDARFVGAYGFDCNVF